MASAARDDLVVHVTRGVTMFVTMCQYVVDVYDASGRWCDRVLVWAATRFAAEGKARLLSGRHDVTARLVTAVD